MDLISRERRVNVFVSAESTETVSFSLYDMTVPDAIRAIANAAENGADVVSISMGGFASWALRDAVNEAYCKGTAVFAAAGNSIHLPVAELRLQRPPSIQHASLALSPLPASRQTTVRTRRGRASGASCGATGARGGCEETTAQPG
jgi:hypothetical protein